MFKRNFFNFLCVFQFIRLPIPGQFDQLAKFIRNNTDALMLSSGLVVVTLLLFPYMSNGFWFDDALNSQINYLLQRFHGGLGEFSYRVVKHWLQNEGRLMFNFFPPVNFPVIGTVGRASETNIT